MKTFKKVFSLALIVISFVLLFTSWTMLTPMAKTTTVEYYNTIFADADKQIDFQGVIRELKNYDPNKMVDPSEKLTPGEEFVKSIYKDSGFRGLVIAVEDGGMDVTQTTLAATTMKNVLNYIFKQGAANGISGLEVYSKSAGALTLYNVIVIILFILSILFAIGSFIARLLESLQRFRKLDLAFFITQILLFVMAVIFVGAVNTIAGGLPVLGISLWGILAIVFACPTVILDKIPFEKAEAYSGQASAMSGTVNKTMGYISNKVDETTQGVKLMREMKAAEETLKEKYLELGQGYYKAFSVNPPEESKEAFQEIFELQEKIEQIQKDIDTVNNVVACEKCGSRWTAGTLFCANCGTKLPSAAPERAEYDLKMKQENEKKAGKSFCKYCGAKVEADDMFCPGCGRSI